MSCLVGVAGPFTLEALPYSWALTHALNAGWTGSLEYGHHAPTRFEPEATTEIIAEDLDGATMPCAELMVPSRGRKWGAARTSSFQLFDKATWALSSGSESFDTFTTGTAADIAAAISSRFGVPIDGAPDFNVYNEDIKLSNGWDPLRRIAVAAGMVLVVASDGSVQFQESLWSSGSCAFWPTEVEEGYRPLDRFSRLFVSRTKGLGLGGGPQFYDFSTSGIVTGELDWPLGPGANPVNEGGVGKVGWVSLWNGHPDSGGHFLSIAALNGDEVDGYTETPTGMWPATHFRAIVYPDTTGSSLPLLARLRINGTPYSDLPPGIDGAIAKMYGTGRGLPSTFSDPLIPSVVFANATWPNWLREANRGTDYLTARGPFQCSPEVGRTWTFEGLTGRIERVQHSQSAGKAPRTEIIVNLDGF